MNTRRPDRFALIAAGVFGLMGVALGAMGAHAMAAKLAENGMTHAWDTGSRYQLMHAVALLGLGVWARSAPMAPGRWIAWAARAWAIGILFFAGSLYGIALGGPRWLGPVTPLGGIMLLLGWICVIVAGCAKET
jgi:uncharacterized membrane protein YgdD (TMEM256/DUF423 family)